MLTVSKQNYVLVSSEQTVGDVAYTAYGVACESSGKILIQVDDVSSDRRLVEKMIEIFNACELPPDRLKRTIINLIP